MPQHAVDLFLVHLFFVSCGAVVIFCADTEGSGSTHGVMGCGFHASAGQRYSTGCDTALRRVGFYGEKGSAEINVVERLRVPLVGDKGVVWRVEKGGECLGCGVGWDLKEIGE